VTEPTEREWLEGLRMEDREPVSADVALVREALQLLASDVPIEEVSLPRDALAALARLEARIAELTAQVETPPTAYIKFFHSLQDVDPELALHEGVPRALPPGAKYFSVRLAHLSEVEKASPDEWVNVARSYKVRAEEAEARVVELEGALGRATVALHRYADEQQWLNHREYRVLPGVHGNAEASIALAEIALRIGAFGDDCTFCEQADRAQRDDEARLRDRRSREAYKLLREEWQKERDRAEAAETLARRCVVALEVADKEASIAHDAIWSDEVRGIGGTGFGILHDNERDDSAQSAIWRLHDVVRAALVPCCILPLRHRSGAAPGCGANQMTHSPEWMEERDE